MKKNIKVKKLGIRRGTTRLLWLLLISSVAFGTYKSFTAVDSHTVHEKETIKTTLIDTSGIESYIKEFTQCYYSWEPNKDKLVQREEMLKKYLTDELIALNQDAVRSDIPTKSNVQTVEIWEIKEKQDNNYQVTYTVTQEIEEKADQKVQKKNIQSAFSVVVYAKDNEKVILQNPIPSSLYKKSSYQPKTLQDNPAINDKTRKEIREFLTTFFKLYPAATEQELSYYIEKNTLPVIGKNYVFSELSNEKYLQRKDKEVTLQLEVTFIDKETKMLVPVQYQLTLKKDGTWKIISS